MQPVDATALPGTVTQHLSVFELFLQSDSIVKLVFAVCKLGETEENIRIILPTIGHCIFQSSFKLSNVVLRFIQFAEIAVRPSIVWFDL